MNRPHRILFAVGSALLAAGGMLLIPIFC